MRMDYRRGGDGCSVAYDSAVSSPLTVRPARVEDGAQMVRVNVRCWQETYRGLLTDAVLNTPGFLAARERFWTAALTDERYRGNRVAVAEWNGELVGIAMSGPPLDAGGSLDDAAVDHHIVEVQADHLLIGTEPGGLQPGEEAQPDPLIAAAAHGGRRAGRVGDPLISQAGNQRLDEVV